MTLNIADHDNFLRVLREAAMQEPNLDLRYGLKAAADGIQRAVHTLCAGEVSGANMTELNNMWAYATRLLNLHRAPKTPNPPQAGTLEAEPQRKAA